MGATAAIRTLAGFQLLLDRDDGDGQRHDRRRDEKLRQPPLLRDDAIAADVDAVCLQRAVGLLGCSEHGEPRARLEIALAADLVTDDRRARRNDDLLLAVLVFDYDRRAIDAGDRR